MKKVFIVALLLVCVLPHLFAQGMLRVSLSDNSPVLIAVDGRYYKKHPSSLTVGNLPEGKHKVKIYSYTQYHRREGGSADLIYEGKLHIEDGVLLNCVANVQNGELALTKENPNNYSNRPVPDNIPPANNGDNGTYNNTPNNSSMPPASPVNMDGTISQAEVNRLQKKVNDKITDTEKLKLMKLNLNSKTMSTSQVAIMMSWLNFETSKLDFTKFAYTRATDPENYTSLENNFSYRSSKQELDNYIQKNKR